MSTSAHRTAGRAGFTLVELLVTLVVLSILMGSALAIFRSQTRNFRLGGQKLELMQNLRYGTSTLDRVLRTTGAGTASAQPMLVYGSDSAVVINANYASDIDDGNAVYINPDLPAGAVDGLTTATPITLPGTAITYPSTNYFWGAATPSRAETISFYFRPDSSTAIADDYVLFQRVNAMGAELVARNIKRYPGRPFFEYFTENTDAAGIKTIEQVTTTRTPATQRLPIRHSVAQHGSAADVNGSALADSIRYVRVNMRITNGVATADSASRLVSTNIRLANNGLVQLKMCGDAPQLSGTLLAIPNLPGSPPSVELRWNASVDEASGEKDVSQYNVYVREQGTTAWETFMTIPAGLATYAVVNGKGLVAGKTYEYAIAAQDCSPQESSLLISAPTLVNP